MQIVRRTRTLYKNMGDLKIGDYVKSCGTTKAKVYSIQEQGLSDTFKINLSDGRSFRTHIKHLTTVCFRQESGKPVWDSLTTEWMMSHPQYHYVILDDAKYASLKWDDIQSLLLEHENEPADDIKPIEIDGVYITSIEDEHKKENCRCITLNNPEGLYYTDDNIITHNSTLSTLAQLYISVHYAMMWHPYRFFGMAMSSIFTQCLGGWNQKKASELLLEPFTNILEGSPYFQRVRTHQDLVDASAEDISDCIHWTTSSPTSALAMQNGVNYKIINGPGSILGQNIISAVISELTMFSDNGWALDLNTDILMKDGSTKKLKDIEIGDELAHPENKENKVVAIPYKKKSDQFKITLDNGKTVLCHRDHIWKVSYRKDEDGNPVYELVTTQFMIEHPELDFDIPEIDITSQPN